MKKRAWKIEYSLTIIFILTIILFMIPTSFASKNAIYISEWNKEYNKVDYMFTAMRAHADSDIVKGLKNITDNEAKEEYMFKLVKPYLRLHEDSKLDKRYHQHYMNGDIASKNDDFKFNNLYIAGDGKIIGLKNINDPDETHPAFLMLIDMNGLKEPNTWGKDIYGINIYPDGKIHALGYGWDIQDLKKDCSATGTGVSCSHYYRIGGEFVE